MAATATKGHVDELIDRMPPSQVPAAVEMLEKMVDAVALAPANAPLEDEDISEEEELAVARARAETGPGTSMEDLVAEYGLTMEELQRMEFPSANEHGKSSGA